MRHPRWSNFFVKLGVEAPSGLDEQRDVLRRSEVVRQCLVDGSPNGAECEFDEGSQPFPLKTCGANGLRLIARKHQSWQLSALGGYAADHVEDEERLNDRQVLHFVDEDRRNVAESLR